MAGKRINIASPLMGDDEISAVVAVMKSGQIAQGPRTREFEAKFAKHVGAKYSAAVANGTSAVYLSLLANDVGEGDEVVTTPFTFIASANAILATGSRPVFVDVGEDFNIDPEKVQKAITKKTKAILPVHLFGLPADMSSISAIARKNKLVVIEDAAQAHGAKFPTGKKVGSGNTCAYSFYATKNMTTAEGGMVVSASKRVIDKVRLLRAHGSAKKYTHTVPALNYMTTDIEAAIGLAQLKKLSKLNATRRRLARHYNTNLRMDGLILPPYVPGHVYHQYTVRVTQDFPVSRATLVKRLDEAGIGTQVNYPIPLHKQKVYRDLGHEDSFPVAERLARETLSLPVHPGLTSVDLASVISEIASISIG